MAPMIKCRLKRRSSMRLRFRAGVATRCLRVCMQPTKRCLMRSRNPSRTDWAPLSMMAVAVCLARSRRSQQGASVTSVGADARRDRSQGFMLRAWQNLARRRARRRGKRCTHRSIDRLSLLHYRAMDGYYNCSAGRDRHTRPTVGRTLFAEAPS